MIKKKDKKQQGVLYIRYDKTTEVGLVIERLKEIDRNKLNQRINEIILLFEGIEILDVQDIDPGTLKSFFLRCLNIYGGKLETIKYRLLAIQGKSNGSDFDAELTSSEEAPCLGGASLTTPRLSMVDRVRHPSHSLEDKCVKTDLEKQGGLAAIKGSVEANNNKLINSLMPKI